LHRGPATRWHAVAWACWLALPALAFAQPEAVADPQFPGAPAWFARIGLRTQTNSAGAEIEARDRLETARRSHDTLSEAYALLALAHARGRQNDMIASSQLGTEALALAERLGDPHLLVEARVRRANTFRVAEQYPAAVELLLQVLRDADQLGLRRTEFLALRELAQCHSALEDGRALEFAERALRCAELMENASAIAAGAEMMGALLAKAGRIADARPHFHRALALRETLGNRTDINDVLFQLAQLDFRAGRAADALHAVAGIERQRRTLRGKAKLTETLLFKADVLTALQRLDEALVCVEEAHRLAAAMPTETVNLEVLRRLAAVHEARGEPALALAAARQAFDLELKAVGESARRRVAELQTRYDVARKDEDLARLSQANDRFAAEARLRDAQLARNDAELRANAAELTRTRWQRLGLALVLGAGAVTLGAIVLAQRSRLRAEQRSLAETRRARAAAEEAAALKSQIVGIASHDLKAPLRAIRMRAAQLETSPALPPDHAAALTQIRFDSDRMLTLIRDLLDMSAVEGGHLTLVRAPAELNALVAEAVEPQRILAQRKGVGFQLAPVPTPLPVHVDAGRLAQAIGNLVDNAVKFTPAGGGVRVTIVPTAEEALVVVADDGPGLQPADFVRMFQPFQTLSAAPTGGEASTGLGLHITREIVARHGGRLEVDSQPGKGATFTIHLPLA
jgi:signal transduction histidine kinase